MVEGDESSETGLGRFEFFFRKLVKTKVSISLLFEFIHRCLSMHYVDICESSLQSRYEICFDLVEHFVFYLLWLKLGSNIF
jgi:hypothetical protein